MKRSNRIFKMSMVTGLFMLLVVFQVWGGEKGVSPKTPAHNPEWTDINTSDPGMTHGSSPATRLQAAPAPGPLRHSVAEDLQKIVVLCATKPQSAEFDRAWAAYLKKHYEPDLNINRLIEEVLTRAETYITFGDGRRGARMSSSSDRNKTRQRMRGVADTVIAGKR